MKIYLLHGWDHDKTKWIHIGDILKRYGYDISYIELPGFGENKSMIAEIKDWSMNDFSDWLDNQLQTEKQNFVVIAHSFGGRVLSNILIKKNITNLTGAVLYGTPLIYKPKLFSRIIKKLSKLKQYIPTISTKLFNQNQEYLKAKSDGLDRIYQKAVEFDITTQLHKITVPILLLSGERDLEVSHIRQQMKDLITNSSEYIIPKTGHNAHMQNPTLFCGVVNKWIESHEQIN